MYPAKPGLVIGFHGCDLTVCNNLVQKKIKMEPSNNSYDWLGSGMYFCENNRQRALDFAVDLKENKTRKSKIKHPAVVGAILDLGFCLNLLDAEYISLVKNSYKNLHTSCEILGLPLPANRNVGNSKYLLLRDLDCAVIKNLHLQRKFNNLKPFDSVRGAFIEGDPLYEKSWIS